MKSITLTLPAEYIIPSIYSTTSPFMNAELLNYGVQMIERMKQFNYEEKMKEKDRRIKEITDELTSLRENNGDEFEQRRLELSNMINDDLKVQLQEGLAITLEDERNARLETQAQIDKLEQIIREKDVKTEKLRNEMYDKFNSVSDIMISRNNRENQVKGALNEANMERLIIQTFGDVADFHIYPKEEHAGDHIFDWSGYKIMWEDKDYMIKVSQKEVDKAFDDFSRHRECEVLIFVSTNTNISGREHLKNINLEIYEGRLVIFISNLKENLDIPAYIKSVIQPIILNVGGFLRNNQTENQDFLADKFRNISITLGALSGSVHLFDKEIF